jgi:MoxR-like ATPase
MKGGFDVSILQLKEIIRMLLADEQARQTSIGLWGPPGMGKTQMFEQVAEEIGWWVCLILMAMSLGSFLLRLSWP